MIHISIITSRLLLCFFVCFISFACFAQKNFQTGIVIQLNRDTTHGEINIRNWEENPKSIEFRLEGHDNITEYNTTQILAFEAEGIRYRSISSEIETSASNTNALEENGALTLDSIQVFAKVIYDGDKSLLLVKTSELKPQFYIADEGNIVLLKHKRFLRTTGGKNRVAENQSYKKQLSEYLSECRSINKEIGQLEYTQNSITGLFSSYYECTGKKEAYIKTREKNNIEFGILAGASNTNLQFVGAGPASLVESDFSSSTNITGGIFFNVSFSGNLERLWLANEILYSTYRVTAESTETVNSELERNKFIEFSHHYLRLNTIIRYKIPVGKLSLFLNCGISNGYSLKDTNYKREETIISGNSFIIEGDAIPEIRKYEQGLIIGGGLKYGKLSIDARLIRGSGNASFVTLSSSTNSLFLLLGYEF